MRELVIAAAGRPRIAVRLHGEPCHDQPTHQAIERGTVTTPHSGRIAEPGGEIVLHHAERAWIEGLDAERVGDDPVGAGYQLAHHVAIAPAGHGSRRRGDHGEIGHDGDGCRASEGSLEAIVTQCRTGCGIAVH
jgi:hypothetical protein